MQFRGTLIEPPPCTINDDGVIDVDFGDRVGINKVDGVNYRQTIGYRITCEPGIGKWDMMLRLNGTATSFDEAAVQTNHRYLGIRIYQNAAPFKVGSSLPIDHSSRRCWKRCRSARRGNLDGRGVRRHGDPAG